VITGGAVVTWLGVRLWPRLFVALMAACDLLVLATAANNLYWQVRRSPVHFAS
jgi:hypothetical protein